MNQFDLFTFYRLLPIDVAVDFRKEVISTTSWSVTTFYNKVNQKYAMTPLEEKAIIRIAQRYEQYNSLFKFHSKGNDDKA